MATEGGIFVSAAGGTFETVLGGTIKPLPSQKKDPSRRGRIYTLFSKKNLQALVFYFWRSI